MGKLVNLARMATSTVGTGTITLGAAVTGFLTFVQAGVVDGDVVSYGIKDGVNSEVGVGTYTAAGTTLSRTPIKSTNADAAISLSGAAEVYVTPLREDIPFETGVLLVDAATILVNQQLGRNFRLNSMAGNRVLGLISNAVAGTEGIIAIKQDATGSRTLNVSTAGYICDGDTAFVIGTVANKWSVISYKVFDSTHIFLQLIAVNCSLG